MVSTISFSLGGVYIVVRSGVIPIVFFLLVMQKIIQALQIFFSFNAAILLLIVIVLFILIISN